MPKSAHGFTLVELLVVIALMALIGIYTLANYNSFGEDQNLKNAVLDIKSQLKTAQTNATAHVICTGGLWQVEFVNATTTRLKCSTSAGSPKTLTLGNNIRIQEISGTSCPEVFPFTISFSSFNGSIDFFDSEGVMPNCNSLLITLQNSKTTHTESFAIERGGGIYGQ